MTSDVSLEKSYRVSKIIGYAMAASLLVYTVVVEVFNFQEISVHLIPGDILEKVRFIFVFLAFACYFIINFVNRKILTKRAEDTTATLLGKLALANIIALALCELPAFLGLILFLGSGNSRDFYPLLVISGLLFYAFFPRYSFWANYSRVGDRSVPS